MKTFVKEIDWMDRNILDCGWRNGYVLIPEGHKYHGVPYHKIPVDVHGGLTFGSLVTKDMAKV